jgi:hypothetical protein
LTSATATALRTNSRRWRACTTENAAKLGLKDIDFFTQGYGFLEVRDG